MLDAKCSGMSGYLLAAVLICGIPYVYPVTKGQRVRSSPDIPLTQFTCVGRPPGYYADLETGCQVYHMCTEGGNQFSYKCPNTTLFQQRMLICAHWYQVNCSRSEQHYGANLLIGQRDKPFVNDDPAFFKGASVLMDKKLKTLHNPDVLQNLGQSASEGSSRQGKAQPNNENFHANRVFQNNLKRDGGSSIGFPGKTTPFTSSFSTTSSPVDSRTTVDLSSLPLAGSVLPGGLKSFQFAHTQEQGLPFNSQTKPQTFPPRSSSPPSIHFRNSQLFPNQKVTQTNLFTSPTPTPNSIDRVNFFSTTKSPSSFTSKFFTDNQNKFQANGFNKTPQPDFKQETSTSEPSFEFLPPSEQNQSNDLTVASQENAFSNRRSTTTPPTFEIGENLPETDVKAIIEQPKNGSLPDDRFNTFIKRFNPFEKPPSPTTTTKPEEGEPEYHTFINRFVPGGEPSPPENNLREQPEHHIFVNRFVLTPEEQKREKDRVQVDKLHDLLPPEDKLTVSFPNFDLMPPHDDSDDSESNKIELHLQDPRRTFFIPSEEGNEFSKADAAPIVVTIPLHSHQKSPPMWFRSNESEDPCGKCHPSFIVNKETCVPCVIIR